MKLIFRIGVLIGALTLMNCYSGNQSIDGKTHVFTLKQKCPVLFKMKVGQSLMFHAPENVSTGYTWSVAKPLQLFQVDQYEQKAKHHANADHPMLGQNAEKIYQFEAIKEGEEAIELIHARAWEKDMKPTDSWLCRIKVS